MTVIIMAMWLWTAWIKFHHQAHQPDIGLAPTTEAGGLLPDITVTPGAHVMNTETDLDSVALNPEPLITAIEAAATMTHIGVDPDHSTGLLAATSHMIQAPAFTAAVVIHPTADTLGMPPEMTADLTIDLENTTTTQPEALHHLHTLHHGSLKTGNINGSQLMTHPQIIKVQMTQIVTLMTIYTRCALSHYTFMERANQ